MLILATQKAKNLFDEPPSNQALVLRVYLVDMSSGFISATKLDGANLLTRMKMIDGANFLVPETIQ